MRSKQRRREKPTRPARQGDPPRGSSPRAALSPLRPFTLAPTRPTKPAAPAVSPAVAPSTPESSPGECGAQWTWSWRGAGSRQVSRGSRSRRSHHSSHWNQTRKMGSCGDPLRRSGGRWVWPDAAPQNLAAVRRHQGFSKSGQISYTPQI